MTIEARSLIPWVVVAGLLEFFAGTYERVYGFGSPPLHDPVAVASVVAALASLARVARFVRRASQTDRFREDRRAAVSPRPALH